MEKMKYIFVSLLILIAIMFINFSVLKGSTGNRSGFGPTIPCMKDYHSFSPGGILIQTFLKILSNGLDFVVLIYLLTQILVLAVAFMIIYWLVSKIRSNIFLVVIIIIIPIFVVIFNYYNSIGKNLNNF